VHELEVDPSKTCGLLCGSHGSIGCAEACSLMLGILQDTTITDVKCLIEAILTYQQLDSV